MTFVKSKEFLLFIGAILCCAGVFLLPPIAQDVTYHDFADERGFASVPNFGDVMSNVPYALVGIMGLWLTCRYKDNHDMFENAAERMPFIVAFVGIMLVSVGSGYYHWKPSNETLVWDRLPMTIGFMGVFSMLIMDRMNIRFGHILLWPMVLMGIISVFYWDYTEQIGQGDLRPYILIQFFPLLAAPFLLFFCTPRYSGAKYLWWMVVWYGAAKLLEYFDAHIFALVGEIVSGHTLKHLASAMATYMLVRYIQKRKALNS